MRKSFFSVGAGGKRKQICNPVSGDRKVDFLDKKTGKRQKIKAENAGFRGRKEKTTFVGPFAEKSLAGVDFSIKKVYNKREIIQAECKTDHGTEKAETGRRDHAQCGSAGSGVVCRLFHAGTSFYDPSD